MFQTLPLNIFLFDILTNIEASADRHRRSAPDGCNGLCLFLFHLSCKAFGSADGQVTILRC